MTQRTKDAYGIMYEEALRAYVEEDEERKVLLSIFGRYTSFPNSSGSARFFREQLNRSADRYEQMLNDFEANWKP